MPHPMIKLPTEVEFIRGSVVGRVISDELLSEINEFLAHPTKDWEYGVDLLEELRDCAVRADAEMTQLIRMNLKFTDVFKKWKGYVAGLRRRS